MILIVDASVAVKWFVREEFHEEAVRLTELGHELVAPDLIFAEVANVLRRRVRLGQISKEQGTRSMDSLPNAFKEIVPIEQVIARAYQRSTELDHSVYDLVYLECALDRTGSVLVTADQKFEAKARAGGYGEKIVSLEAVHAHFVKVQENDNG